MGVAVFDRCHRPAHFNFNPQLFFNFPVQALGQAIVPLRDRTLASGQCLAIVRTLPIAFEPDNAAATQIVSRATGGAAAWI